MEFRSIAAVHPHGHARAPSRAPQSHVPAADARQRGMHLHSDDGAERVRRGQQHGAAHACAQIDKCISIDRRHRAASPPAHDDALKYRWRDGVISRHVPVVPVAGGEVTPRNQAAGPHSKLQVEGMPDEPIFYRQPRQERGLALLIPALPCAPAFTIER